MKTSNRLFLIFALLINGLLFGFVAKVHAQPANRASGLNQPDPLEIQFLNGLRELKYFDTALSYINDLEANPQTPKDVKVVLPLEKAVTLLENSRYLKSPDAQARSLEDAMVSLALFTKKSPKHPRAADANTRRGRIFLEKAKIKLLETQSTSEPKEQTALRTDARKNILQARKIFQSARAGFKKAWEAFPTSIPSDQEDLLTARRLAEQRYLQADIDLALCTYEEAHTHPKGSKASNDLLTKASLEFKAIHEPHRSMIAGLYAHLMQGKCFQEQDDIRKAIGIFNIMMAHRGEDPALIRMKDTAFLFRLECLNHPKRKDHQIVIDEVNEWLLENSKRISDGQALGIKWEQARAYEFLSQVRDLNPNKKKTLIRQVQANAREIKQFASKYRTLARQMYDRTLVALGQKGEGPKNFEQAYEQANDLVVQISKIKERLDTATEKKDRKKSLEISNELKAHLAATAESLELALQFVDEETGIDKVNIVRYRLSYAYFSQKRSLEAAAIGMFLAQHFGKANDAVALDAGYLGLVALSQAHFRTKDRAGKSALVEEMKSLASVMEKNWPQSDRVNDARRTVGQMLRREDEPLKAAGWFIKVPSSANSYANAQMDAGQAYWNAYLSGVAAGNKKLIENNNAPNADDLKKLLSQAEASLKTGIAGKTKQLTKDDKAPDDLVRAKVSLAQIQIRIGKDSDAVKLLTADPYSVVSAVAVKDESKRPQSGAAIQSRKFASFTYQQLLRAYVGTKDLGQARQTRMALEKIAGEDGVAALTAVYVELGRELQNELKELKQSGNEARASEVRNAFESFLADMFARKDGQSYGSLIWIAETYFGLAQGSKDSMGQSGDYFSKAMAAYNEILSRSQSDPKFIEAKRIPAVKLRLVTCKRNANDFAGAEELVGAVLKELPLALNAQFEAAELYQQWGDSGKTEKYQTAISGTQLPSGATIWGWKQTANRLQRILETKPKDAEFKDQHNEARYHLIETHLANANSMTDQDQKQLELQRAIFEINAFTRMSRGLPQTKWWSDLDALYGAILVKQGKPVVALEEPKQIVVPKQSKVAKAKPAANKNVVSKEQLAKQKKVANKLKESNKEYSTSPMIMGVVALVGIVAMVLIILKSKAPKKRKGYMPQSNESAPVFVQKKKRPVASTQKKRVKKSSPPKTDK